MSQPKLYTLSELATGCGVSRQRVHKVLTDKDLLGECQSYGQHGDRAQMLLIPAAVVAKLPWKFTGKEYGPKTRE